MVFEGKQTLGWWVHCLTKPLLTCAPPLTILPTVALPHNHRPQAGRNAPAEGAHAAAPVRAGLHHLRLRAGGPREQATGLTLGFKTSGPLLDTAFGYRLIAAPTICLLLHDCESIA